MRSLWHRKLLPGVALDSATVLSVTRDASPRSSFGCDLGLRCFPGHRKDDCEGSHHYSWEKCPRKLLFPGRTTWRIPALLLGEVSDVIEQSTEEGSARLLGDVFQLTGRTCEGIQNYSSEKFPRSQKGRLWREPSTPGGRSQNHSSEKHPWSQKGRLWGKPTLPLAEVSDVTEQWTVEGSTLLLGDVSQITERTCKGIHRKDDFRGMYSAEKFPTSQNGRLWRAESLLLGEVSEKNCFGSLQDDRRKPRLHEKGRIPPRRPRMPPRTAGYNPRRAGCDQGLPGPP